MLRDPGLKFRGRVEGKLRITRGKGLRKPSVNFFVRARQPEIRAWFQGTGEIEMLGDLKIKPDGITFGRGNKELAKRMKFLDPSSQPPPDFRIKLFLWYSFAALEQ